MSKKIKGFFSVVMVFLIIFTSYAFASEAPSTPQTPSTVTFSPTEINDVLNNPYMGWAPWAHGGPYQQPHRLVYINATWRELEPTKGNYAFEALETKYKFKYWTENGVKIIFRMNMDYPRPTSEKDIPDWLYEELGGDGYWYDIDWGKGFSPNYENQKLIDYHKKLINALGKRYNTDSRIAQIALGSLGHWGEFHTYNTSTFSIPFPKIPTVEKYVQHYIDSFPNKHLLLRRPYEIAKINNFGLYNDSFGKVNQTYSWFIDYINNGYTCYNTKEKHPAMPDYWKTAPSGGEMCPYPGLIYLEDVKIKESLQMIKDSHTSWLGPSSPGLQPKGTSLQENFDKMLVTMGYRFVLKSVSHLNQGVTGSNINIDMDWMNKGVAPFYYDWPLELSLADANGKIVTTTITGEDIKTWLPGSKSISHSLVIPSDLKPGTYTLAVAILDPETGLPGIDLAISGKRSDGRYTLGQINIVNPVATVPTNISIQGATYVEIPESQVTYSDYTAVVTDQKSTLMPDEKVTWSLESPINGVTLNSSNGKMIVYPEAKVQNITLIATSISNCSVNAVRELILFSNHTPTPAPTPTPTPTPMPTPTPTPTPSPSVTSIQINGATFVKIPTGNNVTYSDYTATIKDLAGKVMNGETVTWALPSSAAGITLNSSNGKLIVDRNAKPCEIVLRATSNSNNKVTTERILKIIH